MLITQVSWIATDQLRSPLAMSFPEWIRAITWREPERNEFASCLIRHAYSYVTINANINVSPMPSPTPSLIITYPNIKGGTAVPYVNSRNGCLAVNQMDKYIWVDGNANWIVIGVHYWIWWYVNQMDISYQFDETYYWMIFHLIPEFHLCQSYGYGCLTQCLSITSEQLDLRLLIWLNKNI